MNRNTSTNNDSGNTDNNNNDVDDDDDGIGFSLIMKDLLADLAVDDDDCTNAANHWLSLDLLEQELKQLENNSGGDNSGGGDNIGGGNTTTNDNNYESVNQPYSTSTAAEAALQQQQILQAFQSPMGLIPSIQSISTTAMKSSSSSSIENMSNTTAMDAWSLSLQKFTASSLEADFLLADSARKSAVVAQTTTTPTVSTMAMTNNFEEYNVNEPVAQHHHVSSTSSTMSVGPPPGMMTASVDTVAQQQQQLISQAAAKLVQQLQFNPSKGGVSTEPTTSIGAGAAAAASMTSYTNEETAQLANQLTRNLQLIHENEVLDDEGDDSNVQPPQPAASSGVQTPPLRIPRPSPMTPQNSMTVSLPPGTPGHQGGGGSAVIVSAPTPMPTPIVVKTINPVHPSMMATSGMMPAPPPPPPPIPPHHQQPPPVMPIMAVPLPTTMAWQSPPPPPMNMMMMPPPPPPPPQRVVFANPHPTAPPIPATALASKYMTSRDVAFVVHGMLKPILMSENLGTMSTYHLQYWTRHHPVKPPMPITTAASSATSAATRRTNGSNEESKQNDVVSMELQFRHVKTKEWASERKVLGSTGKTDVTRPRALIAISSSTIHDNENNESTKNDVDGTVVSVKQQRAALWKSRIYCDQAYQCYTAVVDHRWTQSSSSTTSNNSTSVQAQLLKLTKCLGISVQTVLVDTATGNATTNPISSTTTSTTSQDDDSKQFRNQYSVDVKVLELLFKLPKGKILLARVLEDALLPPSVVQVLLPVALPTLFAASISADADEDVTYADDRVLEAWTVVIDTLPVIAGPVLIETVQSIMKHPSNLIVSSTDRMQCTHALLQRGSAMAANDSAFAMEWQETETEFMNLLSSI